MFSKKSRKCVKHCIIYKYSPNEKFLKRHLVMAVLYKTSSNFIHNHSGTTRILVRNVLIINIIHIYKLQLLF